MKFLNEIDGASKLKQDSSNRLVTDVEKANWNSKADITYIDDKVKTDVPVGAKFTDTVYTHPESHPASMITDLSAVATSGSYNDLSSKPSIPSPTTVVDNLTSTSITSALSAHQGYVLKNMIESVEAQVGDIEVALDAILGV